MSDSFWGQVTMILAMVLAGATYYTESNLNTVLGCWWMTHTKRGFAQSNKVCALSAEMLGLGQEIMII